METFFSVEVRTLSDDSNLGQVATKLARTKDNLWKFHKSNRSLKEFQRTEVTSNQKTKHVYFYMLAKIQKKLHLNRCHLPCKF